MSKIVNTLLLLVIYFIFTSNSSAWFTVCDSWNINLSGISEIDICNGWITSDSINNIESFTWKYIEVDLWYWWTNTNYDIDVKISEKLPLWYFDKNKKTIVGNTNPQYSNITWFIWLKNTYSNDIINGNNVPIWFFDNNKNTFINNVDTEFSFPTWFLWNHVFITKKSWWSRSPKKRNYNITYKDFFEGLFKKYSRIKYKKWGFVYYDKSEYNKFITNITTLFSKWDEDYNQYIPQIAKNRTEWYIENNSEFKEKLWLLVYNLREINYQFDNTDSDVVKMYIIKYYIGE